MGIVGTYDIHILPGDKRGKTKDAAGIPQVIHGTHAHIKRPRPTGSIGAFLGPIDADLRSDVSELHQSEGQVFIDEGPIGIYLKEGFPMILDHFE